MSIDSEDSAFEEALRGDLPSDATAARMRRRLLAAGIAVGNGMAATGAAAGTAPGLLAGTAAKVGALSWGVKVGVAAAIAIPTLGLLAESASSTTPAASAIAAPLRAPAAKMPPAVAPVAATPAEAAAPVGAARALDESASPPSHVGSALELKPRAAEPATGAAPPSQLAFEGTEPSAPSRASTLAEETRILDAAFAAIAAGNEPRAAALVQEHATRFPTGLLGRERERARARLNEMSRGE